MASNCPIAGKQSLRSNCPITNHTAMQQNKLIRYQRNLWSEKANNHWEHCIFMQIARQKGVSLEQKLQIQADAKCNQIANSY